MTMKLWLAAVAAAAMVAATGLRADDAKPAAQKKAEPTTEASKKLAELRKSIDGASEPVNAAYKALQAAKDDDKKAKQAEFDKLLETYQKTMAEAGPKFAAFVKDYAADPAALDAIPMALNFSRSKADRKDLYDVVRKHHLKSPHLGQFVMTLSYDESPEAGELLKEIAAVADDKAVKGPALLALGVQAKNKIAGYSSKPTEEEIAKVVPEAEKYFAQAKEFADVKYGNATVGKQVERQLAGLKNIPHLQIGKTAPDTSCQTLDGTTAKLSDLRGKVVVLDIWATWCGPCRAMIPHEREMVKHLEGKPFTLVSVSADNAKDDLTKFLAKEPMPWTHWWNGPDGGIVSDWNIQGYPTIYVIDQKGVIRYKNVRDKALEEAVNKLLAEGDKTATGEKPAK